VQFGIYELQGPEFSSNWKIVGIAGSKPFGLAVFSFRN
jgi:hypothetical protein